jgi:hypothetical protein
MLSELHSLNLKFYSKQNKKIVLHLFVVPQLSSGWQHNYLTKKGKWAALVSSLCIAHLGITLAVKKAWPLLSLDISFNN